MEKENEQENKKKRFKVRATVKRAKKVSQQLIPNKCSIDVRWKNRKMDGGLNKQMCDRKKKGTLIGEITFKSLYYIIMKAIETEFNLPISRSLSEEVTTKVKKQDKQA